MGLSDGCLLKNRAWRRSGSKKTGHFVSTNHEFRIENDAFCRAGDTVGCLLNLDAGEISFFLQGRDLGIAFQVAICIQMMNSAFKIDEFCTQIDGFVLKMMNYNPGGAWLAKAQDLSVCDAEEGIQFFIENDGFCIENDELCTKNDEFRKGPHLFKFSSNELKYYDRIPPGYRLFTGMECHHLLT